MIHATQIATKGIISTYGVALASKGFIIKVEEVFPESKSGGRIGGYLRQPSYSGETNEDKCIRITVLYRGQKFVTEHCIDKNRTISLRDIEVKHDDERIIEVVVKNIRNS